jgi:acyl-CoA synthetase (AMP-forming)/AMP-acid ligase II
VDVENVLMSHPAVAEAAVVAIPDEKWSERPLACVVFKPGQTATPDELNALMLQTHFAKWQLPERYETIDAVPAHFHRQVLEAQAAGAFSVLIPHQAGSYLFNS